MRIVVIFFIFFLLSVGLYAQNNFFESFIPQNQKTLETAKSIRNISVFRLNETAMRQYLLAAPLEFQNNGKSIPLEIPLPNGKTETFAIVESPILAPEIAAQHPEIKTYTGNGLKNKQAIIRISFTSNGFNAIILNIEGDAVYFEQYAKTDTNVYFNYFVKDAYLPEGYTLPRCGIEPNTANNDHKHPGQDTSPRNNTGANLTTFRLAFAANGEFTIKHGGTAASSFADIVGYVNRMTAVYRNELSINFTLVSGTNLIYTNPATDPYTNTADGLLSENTANINSVIGEDNYDIGHALGYDENFGSGGGVASFASVCSTEEKGAGGSVEGDAPYTQVFFDQLVFHEVGHMFSMSHSYNSSIPVCTTRNPDTSVEPGAGATIMSYGFTCEEDDYFTSTTTGPILTFHTISYSQTVAFLATICGAITTTGNTPPVVTMPANYTIPKSTPFALTGSATDVNGDMLTYSWEGTNTGTMMPDNTTLANTAQPPFFRTYDPSPSATRTFPILSNILDGSNYAKGDKLPSVSIATTHRLTVRDNNASGGGVSFGEVTITVDGSIGPFLISNDPVGTVSGNSPLTITWSVNGTDTATPNVSILLSTDEGLTFPYTLLASTPNDGSESVTLPAVITTTARIKVAAVNNVFFDISNFNFTIIGVTATLKVFLEGPLSGTTMSTLLKTNNVLPLSQPYNAAPFNYTGTEAVPSAANFPANLTDWVLVEILNGTTLVERRAAWLLSNGSIVEPDNNVVSGLKFQNLQNGQSYNILIRHRNHLAVMSANAVTVSSNTLNYDFSTGVAAALNSQQKLAGAVAAMYAADLNANGTITFGDYNVYSNAQTNVYTNGDANLDATISIDDFTLFQANAGLIGISQIRY